jgi:AmmeMemoRadiSam system protein B
VAAHAYALLAGRANLTAVLVGPSHRAAFHGVALVGEGAFETPLGLAPVDAGLAVALEAAGPEILRDPAPHREEHSLEMQLPFLQHLVRGLRIVPLLMGSQTRDEVRMLSDALVTAVGVRRDVVLVASSDLSHYHPAPVAHRLDALVVGDVEAFDEESLMTRLEVSHEHACGGGPMVAVMAAAKRLGADRSHVLRYADSGDAGERDKSRVVGYLAAAFRAGGE